MAFVRKNVSSTRFDDSRSEEEFPSLAAVDADKMEVAALRARS